MTDETGRSRKGRDRRGRLSLRFGSAPEKEAPARRVSVRVLSSTDGENSRMLLLEARAETGTVAIRLTASEAAELMFEIGSALEQAGNPEKEQSRQWD